MKKLLVFFCAVGLIFGATGLAAHLDDVRTKIVLIELIAAGGSIGPPAFRYL